MSEWRQRKMATFLSIFYNVPENRTQETEKRRTFSSVSLLCTVISKSSRPIGARKSLVYRKSLDCVAGVLRGIRKSEKGRGKGKRKKDTFFHFCFLSLHSPTLFSRFCTCYANYHAGYCETYIFTFAWLWFVCSTARIRIAVHLWTCSTRMTSLWTVVMPLCRTATARRYHKLIAWMLSCLGGDLVECCFIILFL